MFKFSLHNILVWTVLEYALSCRKVAESTMSVGAAGLLRYSSFCGIVTDEMVGRVPFCLCMHLLSRRGLSKGDLQQEHSFPWQMGRLQIQMLT